MKLDMDELLKTHSCMGNNKTVELSRDDYKDILDVHIPKCDAIPTPINTHPNGFCFFAFPGVMEISANLSTNYDTAL